MQKIDRPDLGGGDLGGGGGPGDTGPVTGGGGHGGVTTTPGHHLIKGNDPQPETPGPHLIKGNDPQPDPPPKKRRGVAPHPSDPPPPKTDPPDTTTNVPPATPTRRTYVAPSQIIVNESAAGLPIDIPLGRFLQGAKWVYTPRVWGATSQYVYGVAAIGEGPLRRITPRADGTPLTVVGGGSEINPDGLHYQDSTGTLDAWVYDGSRTNFLETASGLRSYDAAWKTDAVNSLGVRPFDNLAHVVVRATWDPNNRTSFPTWTFEGEGYRDLFDPRDSTRKYSENRILWIREVLTNPRWGQNVPAAQVNDTLAAAAANDCAVQVFPIAPAAAPGVVIAGSGGLPTGFVSWRYTNVNANGVESNPSPAVTPISVFSGQGADVTVPAGDSFTAKRVFYRSDPGSSTNPTGFRKVGELAGNSGGTWHDATTEATRASGATLPLGPLSEKRFEGGGRLITQPATGRDWINTLRASCLGIITWNAGKFEFYINKALPGGYTRRVFRAEHGPSGEAPNVEAESISWGRKPRQEMPNEVVVNYTDVQNGYSSASSDPAQRPSVASGAELARRATYYCQDVPDRAYANRLARALLNLAWDDMEIEFVTDRSALGVLPFDVVAFSGARLSAQDVRVRRSRTEGEGFRITGVEYQAASYSDDILAGDAPLSIAPPSSPPALGAPTFTGVTETVVQPQPGVYVSKLSVSFTPAAGPGYAGTKITHQVSGGAEVSDGLFATGPAEILISDGPGKTVTIRGYTVSRFGGVSSTAASTSFTTYSASPSEWPEYGNNLKSATTYGFIQFDDYVNFGVPYLTFTPPQMRSRTLYGAAFWPFVGTNPGLINNGDTGTAWGSVQNGDAFILDLGAGNAKALREAAAWFTPYQNETLRASFGVAYSDDNVTYTAVTDGWGDWQNYSGRHSGTSGDQMSQYRRQWAAHGAHRYWKFTMSVLGPPGTTQTLTEIQVHEYLGPHPYITAFKVYDITRSALGSLLPVPVLIGTYPAGPDYNANPIRLTNVSAVTDPATNKHRIAIRVTAVNSAGEESSPVDDWFEWTANTSGSSSPSFVSDAETLRNKTLLGHVIADGTDQTKKAQFDASAITTSTTRTFAFQDASYTLAGRNITEDATGRVGIGGAPSSKLDVVGIIRSTSTASAASSGGGAELYGNGTSYGGLQAYDRGGAAYIPLYVSGSAIHFNKTGPGGADMLQIDANGNVVVGSAALATNATNGFLYIAGGAGAPTGVPTAFTGRVALYLDTTNFKLYAYVGGAWKGVTLT